MVTTRDFWMGCAAGGAFVLVELLGRTVGSVPTLPELVQDRLVLLLPGPVFSFVLSHVLYLGKPLLFGGLLGTQVALGGLGGLIVARWGRPMVLAAILWLITGGLLLPIAGRGPFGGDVRVALSLLASFGAYGIGLIVFRDPRPVATAEALASANRRLLLGGGAMLLASAVLARRVIGALPSFPSRASVPAGGVADAATPEGWGQLASIPSGLPAPVTPPDEFYVVSKNITDPVVDVGSWRLKVEGMVDYPLELRYDDVLAFPAVETYRTLECISNEVGGDLMSNGRWTGILLGDLLQKAGVQREATDITFRCVDGYTETMPLAKALDPSTLLVYGLGGQPLLGKHGFPLRVLGNGTYGMKNPKWLTHIEVGASAQPGFWTEQGWDPDAPVQTMARIDTPRDGSVVQGDEVTIAGVAFAADRGIQRVEVSTDRGVSWTDAQLLPSFGPSTWVFWHLPWRPPRDGEATVLARATDGAGQVQTDRRTDTFPRGATGLHTIKVRLERVMNHPYVVVRAQVAAPPATWRPDRQPQPVVVHNRF